MNVSRETLDATIKSFYNSINYSSSYRVRLNHQDDLLPFFLSFSPGSFLLVEDSIFLSIFNVLYRSNLSSFSV